MCGCSTVTSSTDAERRGRLFCRSVGWVARSALLGSLAAACAVAASRVNGRCHVRVDGDHHQATALRAGVGVVLHRLGGRHAVDGAVHRNELRGDGAARLAVDGQREIAGRLVRDRPPALVDDVDVDRHQVERPT